MLVIFTLHYSYLTSVLVTVYDGDMDQQVFCACFSFLTF